jgi:hypothetical protein
MVLKVIYAVLLLTNMNTSHDNGLMKLRRPFKLQRAPSSKILLNDTYNESSYKK